MECGDCEEMKDVLIIALMVIAAVVFVMQLKKKNAWWLICLYWLVLTVKNAMDVVS